MENSDDVVSESAVDRNPSDTSELLSNTGTSAEVSRVDSGRDFGSDPKRIDFR